MIFTTEYFAKEQPMRNLEEEAKWAAKFTKIVTEKFGYDTSQIETGEWKKVETWAARYFLSTKTIGVPEEHEEPEETAEFEPKIPGQPWTGEKRFVKYANAMRTVPAGAPPEKGLLFCGLTGRGKTHLAKIMSTIFKFPLESVRWYEHEFCENPAIDFTKNGVPLIVDDLGTERKSTVYGSETAITTILMDMYEKWQNEGQLYIVTTNLARLQNPNIRSLFDEYGERVESRFAEMFETVRFIGKDFRRQK